MLLVAFVLSAWVLSGVVLRALDSDEIREGTTMSGVPLGGETREAAGELIAETKPRKVKVSGPRRSVTVAAPQAGLTVDVDASVERAYGSGRGGIGPILAGPLDLPGGEDLEPVYEPVDSKRLDRTVGRIVGRVNREPFVGALSIDPSTLSVTTERPKAGVEVRRGPTRECAAGGLRNGER